MSSTDSDYTEDYDEDYSEASSDSSPAKPAAAGPDPAVWGSSKGTYEGVVHVFGSSNTPLCLSDAQSDAIQKRRAVWDAVSKDDSIALSSVSCTLLQKRPQSDHDLLLSAVGPYATVLSACCQTGDNVHQQDTQTSFIPTDAKCSQAPQDLMEALQGSSTASFLPSQRYSQQASQRTTKNMIQACSPGIKGLSIASGVFPAPPTAFPQRQIVSNLAVSKTCEQPVVAVVYSQVTPTQTDDGSIITVEHDTNTSSSKLLGLNCESIVALWSLKDPSNSTSPGAVLMCHSALVCCDLHAVHCSHRAGPQLEVRSADTVGFIIVGGCTDGSICVWDTRSHPHLHGMWQAPVTSAANGSTGLQGDSLRNTSEGQQRTSAYAPAFSTLCPDDSTAGTVLSLGKDAVGSRFEFEGFEHLEEITQVAIVAEGQSAANSRKSETSREGPGSFSVLVLTATGVVSLWAVVVARGVSRTAPGSFLLDRNGGSVRLVNLHKVVRHGTPRASMVHEAEAFAPAACLAISPSTPTTFLVGAGAGSVTRGALHAPQPSPQAVGSRVVSVSVHPAAPSVFLVAYDMGCLAVFVAQRQCAVLALSCPSPLLAAVWLPGCNDRCAAVTTSGHIVIFYVASGHLKPQEEYKLKLSDGVECTAAVASAWGCCGEVTGKENTTELGAGMTDKQHVLVIGLSTGECIYHVLGNAQEQSCKAWTADVLVAKLLGAAAQH